MDLPEREAKRREIDGHFPIGRSRLRENEVEFLHQLITQYSRFRGLEDIHSTSTRGFSSDGRYTRVVETRIHFDRNTVALHVDRAYRDDDGQAGDYGSLPTKSAREVVDWFWDNRRLPMWAPVRDIVSLIG